MRIFLSIFLLSLKLFSSSASVGLGAYIESKPYKGVDAILLPSHAIFFDNGIFYSRWSRLGLYFLGEKTKEISWAFSITALPRLNGYKQEDSLILKNMDERKSLLETGLAFSVVKDKTFFEIMLVTDVQYKTDTWVLKSSLGYKYSIGDVTFYPNIFINYQSERFTNYYYGVKRDEVTKTRNFYSPDASYNVGVQTYMSFPLTKTLSIFSNISYEKLSSQITTSPIVEDSYMASAFTSLIYEFEY